MTAPISPPSDQVSAYAALKNTWARCHRLSHLQAIASWDQAANMPPAGNEARAAALAEIAGVVHELMVNPQVGLWLQQAEQEQLDRENQANLREMQRHWTIQSALSPDLVSRSKIITSRCEHAWRTQRPANDWSGFLKNFQDVVAIKREEAERLSQRLGVSRYEALMNLYEPGLTTATVDRVFGDLKQWLPTMIQRVVSQQRTEAVVTPQGPFPVQQQKDLCHSLMQSLGFDFQAGRLDSSTHPFCGGVPEDVRLTTRFKESEFITSLFGTIHETGHARYEQNRPRDWLGQPAALARSMAIHESQSLFFEMQLGCHPGFLQQISPLIKAQFGQQAAFEPAALASLMTRVNPGLIRVEADEVSYPAHILLRYDIERKLMQDEIEAQDIPTLWDSHMAELLGVDTRGNFKDGTMQDVHWPMGLFGYFPCYTLGAMYAAQWFATLKNQLPELDQWIAQGQWSPLFDWLKENIWQQASFWTTDELAQRASGNSLDPRFFKTHLEQRYLKAA